MNTIRVIWKKKNPNDKLGYLRLSTRVGNKTILKSLSLEPIEQKLFNPKTERVRTSHTKHEYINNYIESKIKEVEKKGNKLKFINDEKKSLIDYMNKVIERTYNQGTIMKYVNIKNLLQEFNGEKYGDVDVKFSEITVDYIEGWKKWLRERGISMNSVSYKTKSFQSFISKGIKERFYTYDVNPFHLVKNKIEETNIEILNKEDIQKLIRTELKEVYRNKEKFGQIITKDEVLTDNRYRHRNTLNDIRNFFLFQLFCQGIRVSCLMTLRWNNFYIHEDQIRIKKRMVKTKNMLDVIINYNTMEYLKKYIPIDILSEKMRIKMDRVLTNNNQLNLKDMNKNKIRVKIDINTVEKFSLEFEFKDNMYWVSHQEVIGKINQRKDFIKKSIILTDTVKYLDEVKKKQEKDEEIQYLNQLLTIIKIKNIMTNKNIDNVKGKNLIKSYILFSEVIEFLSTDKKTKNNFCFPILKNEDFISINENNDFGNMTKHQYLRFSGGRSYYNRLLKVISEQCEIKKNLKSHLSRHTFTSLILEFGENVNMYDVMDSLGHKNLNTTQGYIQKFKNKRVDILNIQLSDFLNNKKN